jgi:hypothetical protein
VANVGTYNILQPGLTLKWSNDVSSNYTSLITEQLLPSRNGRLLLLLPQVRARYMVQLIQSLLTLTRQQSSSPAQGLAFTDAFSGALTRDAGENVGTYNILQRVLLLRMEQRM